MTLTRPPFHKLLAPLLAFALTLAVVLATRGGDAPSPTPSAEVALGSQAEKDARKGDSFLQQARETADPAFYERAERAFVAALRRDPRNLTAVVGAGTLALARHDFRSAHELGQRAVRLAPATARPYAVLADAKIELGRYEQAERTIQRFVDLRPALASYARVSYYRELTGDLAGAAAAMRLAVSAGAGTPENLAYVNSLLGGIELQRGRIGAARAAYRDALAVAPDHAPSQFGLARIDVAQGELKGAADDIRAIARQVPVGEYFTLLGEIELVLGREAAAARHLEVVHEQHRQELRSGAKPDAGLVLVEARHGDPDQALAIARRIWRLAPSVSSADALGYALTRAGQPAAALEWARRARRIGTDSSVFRLHAGLAAAGAGRPALARAELATALARPHALSPLDIRTARRTRARL